MSQGSTTVFRRGAVFRADAARSWATAVAVRDGVIVAIGGDADVAPHLAKADEVVDLAGRLLSPGFIDAHAHPVLGGLERSRCDLSGEESLDHYATTIRNYVRAHPERDWVVGGGWGMSAFPGGCPTRVQLDELVGDRPAYLPNRDHHSAWVSTRALKMAGIDKHTPNPSDGRIERDSTGEPTGALHEGAADLVARLLPPDTQADLDEGLAEAQRYLHSLGVIGWQDAMVPADTGEPSVHSAYLRAQRKGSLSARVRGCLWWPRECPMEGVSDHVAQMLKLREETASLGNRYCEGAVKVMQDGVAETFTAAMLDPYLDRCGHASDNTGLSFLPPDLLKEVVRQLDAAGFQVHFHALGDRAVREVLDALQSARQSNGTADRRHHLAHLQVVHPDDIGRFAALGAVANLQPLWAAHEPQMDELTIPFLGEERAGWQYAFGDLHRAGATLAMGSDWPVSSPDPIEGIHVAVNRVVPGAPAQTPPLGSNQKLALTTAWAAYTAGSAYVSHLDGVSGSIVVGNRADLVVLDRNPFDGPLEQVADARIDRTYVDGQLVYQA